MEKDVFKGKVVFITGASGGIGLATAKKFSENGWKIAGFYNNTEGPTVENCEWFQGNVSNFENLKSSFMKAFAHFGRIDSLINCAGIMKSKHLKEYDTKMIDEIISVNEKGTYFATKIILDQMRSGSIVNISSTAAQVGSPDPIYAASKAAILGFTKSMAKQLAPNIRVNAVAPGITNSDLIKTEDPKRVKSLIKLTLVKKMAEPTEIASAIYFLASDEASHITGACLDVNGGYVLR